jgi:hypothetical protein
MALAKDTLDTDVPCLQLRGKAALELVVKAIALERNYIDKIVCRSAP